MTEILARLQTLFPAGRGSSPVRSARRRSAGRSPTLVAVRARPASTSSGHAAPADHPRPRQRRSCRDRDLAVVKLNMDAVGVLDFDAGTVALDAVLVRLQLVRPLRAHRRDGDARWRWKGTAGFALAVGGMHPRFAVAGRVPERRAAPARADQRRQPEADLPGVLRDHVEHRAVRRRRVALRRRLRLQHRGRRRLRRPHPAAALPLPRRVPRERSAQARHAATCSRSRSKASSRGRCRCASPARRPSRSSGATSRCAFNTTLVDGGAPNDVVLVDVLAVLVARSSDAAALAGAAARRGRASSSASASAADAPALLLHPLGSLDGPPDRRAARARRATSTGSGRARPAGTGASPSPAPRSARSGSGKDGVRELFAPAQFFDMSDDEKLAAPSFEAMDAGVTFGDGGLHVRARPAGLAVRLHRHHHRRRRQAGPRAVTPSPTRSQRARADPAERRGAVAASGARSTSGSPRRSARPRRRSTRWAGPRRLESRPAAAPVASRRALRRHLGRGTRAGPRTA